MYRCILLRHFQRQIKFLEKKHPLLRNDVVKILTNFSPKQNIYIGKGIFKIRISSQGLLKGKNSSFRLYILVAELNKTIYPITLYYKGDQSNISRVNIDYHARCIRKELDN